MKRMFFLPVLGAVTVAACGTNRGGFQNGGPDGGGDGGVPIDAGFADGAGRGGSGDGGGPTTGTGVTVDPNGTWSVTFQTPSWTFGGSVGVAVSSVANGTGVDKIGAYRETTFEYSDSAAKRAGIRAYDHQPIVIFTETYVTAAANNSPFPVMSRYPQQLHHLTHQDIEFGPFDFTNLVSDSPWLFFDDGANAFLLSAATHFLNAGTYRAPGGAISSGIDTAVTAIPAGFATQTILVVEPGINRVYETWGHALTSLSGKKRTANDATVDLERLGYWTDNGAYYYYNFDIAKGYAGTILAVRDYFQQLGIPLAYMQLDSWWYPKGNTNIWNNKTGGQYTYSADPTLFAAGLPAFQQSLGLPLITHARWIDPASPYRTTYKMSNNVSIDSAYWDSIIGYIQAGGVITYEQDWLNANALPLTNNLTDQDAFLDGMAAANETHGLSMQYCMPLPRHYLQSTKYDNLITTRVSGDHFMPARWHDFLYGSRLASAVGEWPWVDVFMSSEEDNLLLATLSAGMVGVGDQIGMTSKTSLLKSIRADGVIVKPDVPLVPLDQTFIDDARATGAPLVAATYSDFGVEQAAYVFAFSTGANQTVSFKPSALGFTGNVYIHNYYKNLGQTVPATLPYVEDVVNGRAYYILVPVSASGIAFLGDPQKFVSLGKKRFSQWSESGGTITAALTFAAGETSEQIHGWAPSIPTVTATVGAVGPVMWNATNQHYTVTVTPAGGAAAIAIH